MAIGDSLPEVTRASQTDAFVERSRQRIKKLEEETDAEVEFSLGPITRAGRSRARRSSISFLIADEFFKISGVPIQFVVLIGPSTSCMKHSVFADRCVHDADYRSYE